MAQYLGTVKLGGFYTNGEMCIRDRAGLSKMKLSSKTYPTRKMLPIRRQTAVQAINTVNAAWGLRVPFFFSGGVFYWDEKPEQKKVYTFERGVNILNLRRAGGVWELETVSAPFIKHSHKINLIHPQVSGEVEVSKVDVYKRQVQSLLEEHLDLC